MRDLNRDFQKKGLIFEIQRMATEDGPGIRTTVFMKQCNLKCIWCHNPESILKKPQLEWIKNKCIDCKTCIKTCSQKALVFIELGLNINRKLCNNCKECVEECPSTALHMIGEKWDLKDLFYEINKDKVYYSESGGGITISGGEPTLQHLFIKKLLKKCKDNGISTALETCGYSSLEVLKQILPLLDIVLLDIKEINNEKHIDFTGVPNKTILENAIFIAEFLKKNDKKLWIRTPVIPRYTATDNNIIGIGKFIVNQLKNFPERWDLLAFNNLCVSKYERLGLNWTLKHEPMITTDQIEHYFDIARQIGVKNVNWSGLTRKKEIVN